MGPVHLCLALNVLLRSLLLDYKPVPFFVAFANISKDKSRKLKVNGYDVAEDKHAEVVEGFLSAKLILNSITKS